MPNDFVHERPALTVVLILKAFADRSCCSSLVEAILLIQRRELEASK